MNSRTPYWPLFRNELGLDHYPRIPWALGCGFYLALWVAGSFVPLLLLFKGSQGNLGTFFAAFGELTGMALVWWLMMTGWLFAFALLPGISNPIQSVRAFEFMFTRAIDRRQLFRTRSAVIYAMMLGPLLISVVVSACLPPSALGPDAKFHLPHGEVVFAAWIFWLATVGLLFMHGYCALIAPSLHHNPWLAGIVIGAPVLAACFLAPWVPRHYPQFYAESFLFFGRNPMPLLIGSVVLVFAAQIFSERTFSKLEIL